MKNKILRIVIYFLFLLLNTHLFAQESLPCGANEMTEQSLQQNSYLLKQVKQLTKEFEKQHHTQSQDALIIPVVIHVIHNYGSENISFAQVEDLHLIAT